MEYPNVVRMGGSARVKMWWVNAGVAPIYSPYVLAVAIDDAVLEIPGVDVRKWLPGDAVVDEALPVPRVAAGEHRVKVALLDPRTKKPAIRLGTEGRREDGWYELGSITVE
jgi:hypothetical protein